MTAFALPADLRAELEASFGTGLAHVRVHLHAAVPQGGPLAWALGDDIHLTPGAWEPGRSWSRQVLGHEVAHVVQQRAGRVGPGSDRAALEAEAHTAGRRYARGLPVRLPEGPDGPGPGCTRAVATPAFQGWNQVTPGQRAGAGVVVGASVWSSPTASQDAFIGQNNINYAAAPAATDPPVSFLNPTGQLRLVSADPAGVTLRVSANGRLAIEDCQLTARQPKVFYATQALIDESNAWRRALGEAVELVPDSPLENQTVTVNGQVLRRVTARLAAWGGRGIAAVGQQNCNDIVSGALGAGELEVAAPDGIGALPVLLPEFEIARFLVNPAPPAVTGAPHSIQQADSARVIATAYGTALRTDTWRMVAGTPANRHFGVNQYVRPDVGETFMTISLQAIPAGGTLAHPELSTDHSRAGAPVLDLTSFWSAHYAGVVIRDGDDVITLENYARNKEDAPSDDARARVGHYFQMYDTSPGAPLAHTFHGSWTSAAVRPVNAALPGDAAKPAGTTHRPVPNGVKSFTNPLTVRTNLTGLGYDVQLPGLLANQTDDQLRTAYTAAAGGAAVSPLIQLRTVGKGRLYAHRLEALNKRVPVGDVDPWMKLLSMMSDPAFGTDRRLRGFVTHTLAAFTALPTK
ncbi:DUF4157 domain-containing protein [Streptomyces sp. S3(2020)]|uniref:eCIS core domain-containing protein n=1 Tax=Streptomyces sp. S3(2020) TaxID=2732044 RepID=UPI001487674D|nr:DUF4157 domain-containing protein [Streptomyces sp. S3(2020)]NNN29393.1 DUF4157 domain-containing protein [Streptomyces sp. S3(2020)]